MNEQLLDNETDVWLKRIVSLMVVLGSCLTLWLVGSTVLQAPDPYIESVLARSGDPARGHAIFLMNCAGCHAQRSDSQVGPSLEAVSQRRSRVSIIKQVIGGKTPPMPQFQPSSREMADLLSYIEKL
ncbi:MAG: c-type cytochrome [Microcoleaceae cyanobacterium]